MSIKVFTEKEYYKAKRLYPNLGKINFLKEKGEEYHLETENEYEVHNEHDKILEGGIDMSGFVNTLREDREKIIKNKR